MIWGFLLWLCTVNLHALFHENIIETISTIFLILIINIGDVICRIVPITPDIKMKAIFFNSTKMHDSIHWPLCSQSHNLLNTAASPVSPSLSPLPPSLPQSVQFLPLHHRHPGVSKHHKANHSVRGRGVAVRNLGLPTTASMLRTLELRDFHVSDTSYLHSMNAYLDFLNTHMFFLLYFID